MGARTLGAILIGLITMSCASVPAPNVERGDDFAQRQKIMSQVTKRFAEGDFESLEEMASDFQSNQSRTASGLWKLTSFYRAVDRYADKQWLKQAKAVPRKNEVTVGHEDLLAWIDAYPDSPTANIAGAIFAYRSTLNNRRYHRSNLPKATAERALTFAAGVGLEALEATAEISSMDPHWHLMVRQFASMPLPDALDADKVLAKGRPMLSGYYQYYLNEVTAMAPVWLKDSKELDIYTEEVVNLTKKSDQRGMYARMHWVASGASRRSDYFRSDLVNWEKMKVAMDDVLRLYPDQWNINNFARFACEAKDKKKARELLRMIEKPSIVAWRSPRAHRDCLKWVSETELSA